MKRKVEDALDEAASRISSDDFVRAILTGARKGQKPEFLRVDLRPVKIKEEVKIQIIAHDGKKDFTRNLSPTSPEILSLLTSGFANVIVESTSESYQVQITKKDEAVTGISKTKLERNLAHDHQKRRLIPENHPVFQALEMSDLKGHIKPSKRGKYIQIDQLLRILEPGLANFREGSELRVVDLASGSAALTMAVHAYLAVRFKVATTGIEQNPELVAKSAATAKSAGLSNISFEEGSIEGSRAVASDLVLALHACDSATDDAIEFVLRSRPAIALIVPCCHQTRSEGVVREAKKLAIFGQDGIVDERIMDLATDSLRANRLRESEYSVDIVEFVGDEHTARNLLLRAFRKPSHRS